MSEREHDELPSPNDVVLGPARGAPRKVVVIASIAAAVLHLGAGAVTVALASTKEQAPKRESRPMVVIDHEVDLTPPPEEPPPPPPPVEETPPPPPPPAPKVKQKAPKAPEPKAVDTPPPPENAPEPPPDKPPSEPPPAAQTGQVVAAEGPGASFAIATGQGNNYAGGTSSSSGTGTQANHTGQVGSGNGNGYSKARPAQLRSRNWPCGWPPEAEDLDLEEAFATVRVSVQPDGSISDVQVLSDPGYGFGKRAASCARSKVKFDPALDANGTPIAGSTPPLRIRFTREE